MELFFLFFYPGWQAVPSILRTKTMEATYYYIFFTFIVCWQNVYRPDMTVLVDWAKNIKLQVMCVLPQSVLKYFRKFTEGADSMRFTGVISVDTCRDKKRHFSGVSSYVRVWRKGAGKWGFTWSPWRERKFSRFSFSLYIHDRHKTLWNSGLICPASFCDLIILLVLQSV